MTGKQKRPMDPLTQALIGEIRGERHAQARSQEDVIRASGVGRTAYTEIERGARGPNVWQVQAIAHALHIEVSELFRRAETRLEREVRRQGPLTGS